MDPNLVKNAQKWETIQLQQDDHYINWQVKPTVQNFHYEAKGMQISAYPIATPTVTYSDFFLE